MCEGSRTFGCFLKQLTAAQSREVYTEVYYG